HSVFRKAVAHSPHLTGVCLGALFHAHLQASLAGCQGWACNDSRMGSTDRRSGSCGIWRIAGILDAQNNPYLYGEVQWNLLYHAVNSERRNGVECPDIHRLSILLSK